MESTSATRINIDGYHVYTNLESESHQGVAICIANSMNHQSTAVSMRTPYEESVWVSIDMKGHDKLLVGCVYRSPSSTELNNARLCQLIQQSSDRGYSHITIEGDFNYPEIEWTTWMTSKSAEHHSQ